MTNGWKTEKLGELFDIARGGSPRPIERFITTDPAGINWIKIGDTKGITKYICKTEEKIRPEGVKRSRLVVEGDFILSNSMSFGRPYIMKTTGCIHDGWLVLREREREKHRVDQNYLYYVLSSDLVFRQFERLAAGSIVRNLNVDSVKSVGVPIPSLPEQRRIVGILDEAFDGIATAKANAEKNLQNARHLFESHLQFVFAQACDGQAERSLVDVCEISSSLVDPREAQYLDLPHVGGANIESKTGELINLQTAREEGLISGKFIFDRATVLYSKIRPYLMKVARPNFRGLCSADIYPLSPRQGQLERNYLFYLLLSPDFTAYANSGSARAGMPKVNREHLFAFRTHIPPLDAQRRVAAKLDALHERTRELESIYCRKLAALDTLWRSLLHQAFADGLTEDVPTPIPFPVPLATLNTTDTHAGILAMACALHEQAGKLDQFTHVKAEKIAHMIEARLGIGLGRTPVKDAAGPNDFNHLKKVEHRAKMTNAFDFKRTEGGAYQVQRLGGFDRLIAKTRTALGERAADVDRLLAWMLPMKVRQAEIVATVFAAWNNLLLDGKNPSEEEIVYESRENWHPDKLKIERWRFFEAISWLRKEGVVPEGKGMKVGPKGK